MDMPRNCWNGHGQSSTAACGPHLRPGRRPPSSCCVTDPTELRWPCCRSRPTWVSHGACTCFLAERWMRPTPPVGIRG